MEQHKDLKKKTEGLQAEIAEQEKAYKESIEAEKQKNKDLMIEIESAKSHMQSLEIQLQAFAVAESSPPKKDSP